jgi:hypothetical protein
VKLAILATLASLQTVLAGVSDYVVRYQKEISSVVAEEHYVQDSDKSDRPFITHRELKSDLLLLRTAGESNGYVQFRDVFEVDGDPVRDRTDRLMKLFVNSSADDEKAARKQAAQIMNESARYNIGSVERNINVPLLALLLLDPTYQSRFKFSVSLEHKGTPRGLPKTPAFTLAQDVWELDFEETTLPTIVRGDNQDAKSHGRVWIDPDTNRVLITELVNEAKTVRSTIRVSFQSEPVAGFLLPVEMRERYERKGGFYKFDGAATYSNYRRFTVSTAEEIGKPEQ